jgi:hypothetical protein
MECGDLSPLSRSNGTDHPSPAPGAKSGDESPHSKERKAAMNGRTPKPSQWADVKAIAGCNAKSGNELPHSKEQKATMNRRTPHLPHHWLGAMLEATYHWTSWFTYYPS